MDLSKAPEFPFKLAPTEIEGLRSNELIGACNLVAVSLSFAYYSDRIVWFSMIEVPRCKENINEWQLMQ